LRFCVRLTAAFSALALEQLRQNFRDLAHTIGEWARVDSSNP
jgi:hypothetical protein